LFTLHKVKVQFTRKSLVIKCSGALGSHENLCRDYERPPERHVSNHCGRTKLFKQTPTEQSESIASGRKYT